MREPTPSLRQHPRAIYSSFETRPAHRSTSGCRSSIQGEADAAGLLVAVSTLELDDNEQDGGEKQDADCQPPERREYTSDADRNGPENADCREYDPPPAQCIRQVVEPTNPLPPQLFDPRPVGGY